MGYWAPNMNECPVCGREFAPTNEWTYKMLFEGKMTYLCSWKCFRQKEREQEAKSSNRIDLRKTRFHH